MRTITVELKGVTPILMHSDDVLASDELSAFRKDPKNKNSSVAGDDRSPPWSWHTYCYFANDKLAWPSTAVQVALRNAGKSLILKKQKTFKTMAASGMIPATEFFDFFANGKPITSKEIKYMRDLAFMDQKAACQKLGFDLLVKRAAVGNSKHVRVRPVFGNWSIVGQFHVTSPELTDDILKQLFTIAGSEQGLGDWRPSAPKSPGSYGLFKAKMK